MSRIVSFGLFSARLTVFFAVVASLSLSAAVLHAQTAMERVAELKKQAGQSNVKLWCEYVGKQGPGKGRHIVLISGDDEYRSEEAMPMLGKILAKHHGFKCSVLFAIDPADGTIKPNHQTNIPGMHLLESADLVVLGLRFRGLPDDQMKHFDDYLNSGKPIIGTRTSTHAFNFNQSGDSKYKKYSFNSSEWKGGFGQQVLGDTWISHHGRHKVQSARGVIVEENKDSPILKGVSDVWGPSDVYGIVNLPESAKVLLDGQVLEGMEPTSKPVEGKQNNPMMPLAWTKDFKTEAGTSSRIFNTTMGASTDFQCEDLRRLVVNACFWALEMESAIPSKANVDYVGPYKPTPFGFGTFQKGVRPSDYDWSE